MGERARYIAIRRDRKDILTDAYLLRKQLGLEETLKFPIVHFIENVLPTLCPGFDYIIVPDDELRGRAAETDTYNKIMVIRESVYNAACEGGYNARWVLAREVGHLMYHTPETIRYAKFNENQRIPKTMDPEKQADYFAASLLIPLNLTKGMVKHEIASKCGVSLAAAARHIEERNRMERRRDRKKESATKRNAQLPRG